MPTRFLRSPLFWIATVLRYVNKELDSLEGYSGRVADLDISLWRGAYQIQGAKD